MFWRISMEKNILKEIENSRQGLIQLRREFHQIPELGFEELKTSKKIAGFLTELGLQVESGIAKTGVVGLLEGKQSRKTILYRADIDGLPIQEENKIGYCSKHPGVMHACGHDAHISMALITAKILSTFKNKLAGSVKFCFQPAEETVDGAKKMIEYGVLDNPKVDAAFGFHVWNFLPAGKIGWRSGSIMAASNQLDVQIFGKESHGAMPHEGKDSIVTAATFIQQIQNIVSRKLPPGEKAVISFGKIYGGAARNIIAREVKLEGTIRTFQKETSQKINTEICQIAKGLEISERVKIKISNIETAPAVINDGNLTTLVVASAENIVGKENVICIDPLFGSEDISEFFEKVPGCYIFIGSKRTDGKIFASHHNPKFNIDEKCLIIGVKIAVNFILRYFDE